MACHIGQPFRPPLLELPLEIRLRIYAFIFTGSDIYVQLVGESPQDWRLRTHGNDIGIFLTSRQLHHETRHEWHAANIRTLGFLPTLGAFFRSVSSVFLAHIKHLTIQIHDLPDLKTKLLPSLRMLIIDFTTDLPSFMTGAWYDDDDEEIYLRFLDEATDREHNTFKVLITQLHQEKRTFQLGLFASDYNHQVPARSLPVCVNANAEIGSDDGKNFDTAMTYHQIELHVNLDTKLVERRSLELGEVDTGSIHPEGGLFHVRELRAQDKLSASQASGPEDYLEDSHHLLDVGSCKFPPGRESYFNDADDRGSIRGAELSDDSDHYNEVDIKKDVDWEDVKRIIEHPSEDEQSVSDVESADEGEVSKSPPLKVEVDCQARALIPEPQPISPGSEPEACVSADGFRGKGTDVIVEETAVEIENGQHGHANEGVI